MNVVSFIADSAADALQQIHAQLGPNAVVVSVRKRPAQGLARLWQGSAGIEVLATVPEPVASPERPVSALPESELLIDNRPKSGAQSNSPGFPASDGSANGQSGPLENRYAPPLESGFPNLGGARSDGGWRSVLLLERMGLLPLCTERLIDALYSLRGPVPPESLADELALTRSALTQFWRPPPPLEGDPARRPHVFVGPPGAGKTTVLCKWLTQSVLIEGRAARVWRLDGAAANTAESLSVYGDILGVPVERFWNDSSSESGVELSFIDLPGVEAQDGSALNELGQRVRSLPSPRVHLVLNAAYEVPTLLAQIRAFSALPITDLIFTHLDEEPRWAKLWNVVLGTNYSVLFLSSGQNIPGRFWTAEPEQLFPPQFQ